MYLLYLSPFPKKFKDFLIYNINIINLVEFRRLYTGTSVYTSLWVLLAMRFRLKGSIFLFFYNDDYRTLYVDSVRFTVRHRFIGGV